MSAPHDALLVDLDGTVYRGSDPVGGAVEALEAARARGVTISYVTNNASRSPASVCEQLAGLGLTLTEEDVVTSAQAAAALLEGHCTQGDAVLVLGTEALAEEVRAVGLRPVRAASEEPVAVVQGLSKETGWADLAEATVALAAGARWVACNVDPTLPSERGFLPGNGALVAALRAASDREPEVAGKPESPLLAQAVERVSSRRPLVIGDRLDTDIAGAHALGADSLLVLTGVSTAAQVLGAPAGQRPTFLAADLSVLGDGLEATRVQPDDVWTVRVDTGTDGDVVLDLDGDGDALTGLRSLCAAVWTRGESASTVSVRADGEAARGVVDTLGLTRATS